MKFQEKNKAINLRMAGLSYSEILKNVEVSKSTLSIWLRDIELTKRQQERLVNKMDKVRYEVAKRKVRSRKQRTKTIINKAKKEIGVLKRDPLFFTGLSLYWAEGAKNPVESVKFANSDKILILFMMKWFRKICKVPENKFRIHIHMHNLHTRSQLIKFWSRITKVSVKQFYKPYIKNTSLGQRRNILYNGTCSIIIHDKTLFRRIVGWKLGMQKYFNILS